MKTNYLLIDYENVQPKDLGVLNGHPFVVVVFLGANQTKIAAKFAEAMQARGEGGRYVRIAGNGRNALDFHIAFHLGELAEKCPDSYFYVISKDTGFDPLIRHLTDRGLHVRRSGDLAEIPMLGLSLPQTVDERVAAIVKDLARRGQARPRKRATLANAIHSLFGKKLDELELNGLVDELARRGHVEFAGTKVTYSLS
jgi:hypothetical protein